MEQKQNSETEYKKFKSLLEYFVAHLEYCVNNKKDTKGYQKYIEGIKDSKDFKKVGRGHKENNIQNQVKKWDIYENGKICINIQRHQKNGYKTKASYLCWKGTGLNVIANWQDNTVTNLKIVENSLKKVENVYRIIDSKDALENTLTELGLFDDNEPNDNLKAFFDKYNSLIIKWNKDNKDMEQIKPYVDLLKSSKNLIFTGAPGTGKTYLAKQIAKQIIGVTTDEELENSGQFAFVQFHPSYDYTDFVEGLRPTKPDENSNIGFELKDGVFKEFCKKAKENLIDSKKSLEELQNKSNIEAILDDFLEDAIKNKIEFDNEYGNNIKKFVIIPYEKKEYFRIKPLYDESMERQLVATGNTKARTYPAVAKKNVIKVLEKANKIYTPMDIQKLFNTGSEYQYTVMFQILERLKNKLNTKTTVTVTKIEKKDFIFVIDEINRGEISKIFGELFFSIDPSYRGEKGTVATQYSNMHETNEKFYVPENVYIIGTMNDIDRSVESFDFAMRRRFTWKEITAEESAENMPLSDITKKRMKNLNDEISKIHELNSSYHIGGAYFLNDNGDERKDYNEIWKLRLCPLLFEYLRGTPNAKENLEKLERAYNGKVNENDRQ